MDGTKKIELRGWKKIDSLVVTSTNPAISDQQIHCKIRELNKIVIRTRCVV